jgi:hypothetical protein
MTETKSLWQERVRAWRASGMKAAVFAAEHGYSEATLRWWASQLSRPPEALQRRDRARSEPAKPVVLARVVRKAAPPASIADAGVTIEIGDARVVVTRSSDESALRLALRVLGGSK